jgi:hypothetical protein
VLKTPCERKDFGFGTNAEYLRGDLLLNGADSKMLYLAKRKYLIF